MILCFALFDYPNKLTYDIVLNLLIGWTIFSFHLFNSSGLIKWFLSHPLWQPLSKLTLSTYIFHMVYLETLTLNIQESAYYNTVWIFHIIVGDIVICNILGLIAYLFVEAPASNLMKYFMRSENKVSYKTCASSESECLL